MRTNKDLILSIWGEDEIKAAAKVGRNLLKQIDEYRESTSAIEVISYDKQGNEIKDRVTISTRTLFKGIADRVRYIIRTIGQ